MKPGRILCLGMLLLFTGKAFSQQEYRNLSLGASAGKGYAIDFGYGKRTHDPGGHDTGWDLLFSLWTPEYRLPISTDNTPQTTLDDYLGGAYIESSRENILGIGIGTRYVFKPFTVGGMFDLVLDQHIDYYYNPSNNSRTQDRQDATLGGWTGTISCYITDRITLNGYYGTRRGINAGLSWNFIDP